MAGFHRAAPAVAVDASIPGTKPDLAHVAPDAHVDAAHGMDVAKDMQASAYATQLMLSKGKTDDKKARWEFLNTLDRIDDPVVRAKVLAKFREQNRGQSLEEFIKHADWDGGRDKQQALEMISS